MKKTSLLTIILIAIALLSGCSKAVKTPNITMSFKPRMASCEAQFYLNGNCETTIDWGDGSENTIVTLANANDYGGENCVHKYSDNTEHIISIYGDSITRIDCSLIHDLPALDVSKCLTLKELELGAQGFTSIDVSKNTQLKKLYCSNNQLTTVDVSKNTLLENFSCWRNNIEQLDLSNNPQLKVLQCYNNKLKNLDVSKNETITCVECENNQLSAESLNKLFEGLNAEKNFAGKSVRYGNNPGSDDCNPQIGEDKGWKMKLN
jgi:hypothetical protein